MGAPSLKKLYHVYDFPAISSVLNPEYANLVISGFLVFL